MLDARCLLWNSDKCAKNELDIVNVEATRYILTPNDCGRADFRTMVYFLHSVKDNIW